VLPTKDRFGVAKKFATVAYAKAFDFDREAIENADFDDLQITPAAVDGEGRLILRGKIEVKVKGGKHQRDVAGKPVAPTGIIERISSAEFRGFERDQQLVQDALAALRAGRNYKLSKEMFSEGVLGTGEDGRPERKNSIRDLYESLIDDIHNPYGNESFADTPQPNPNYRGKWSKEIAEKAINRVLAAAKDKLLHSEAFLENINPVADIELLNRYINLGSFEYLTEESFSTDIGRKEYNERKNEVVGRFPNRQIIPIIHGPDKDKAVAAVKEILKRLHSEYKRGNSGIDVKTEY
jgi:hypothetical protein